MATDNVPNLHQRLLMDELTEKIAKLSAMLCITYGEGGESFRNHRDTVQDCYLWACSDLAYDVKELVGNLSGMQA